MKIRTMTRVALFAALTAVGAFIRLLWGYSSLRSRHSSPLWRAACSARGTARCRSWCMWRWALSACRSSRRAAASGISCSRRAGFLIGLIPAAWVIGRIAGRKPEPKQIVPACLLGYGVLYAIGVPYMALILNTFLGKGMGFSAIMWAGMIPFLPGDMIKILCITLLMPPILRQLDKLDK